MPARPSRPDASGGYAAIAKAWRKACRLGRRPRSVGPKPSCRHSCANQRPRASWVSACPCSETKKTSDKAAVVEGGPHSGIVAEAHDGGGMQRDQA